MLRPQSAPGCSRATKDWIQRDPHAPQTHPVQEFAQGHSPGERGEGFFLDYSFFLFTHDVGSSPEPCPCPSGRVLHGDLCVHAAPAAAALQRSGAAAADAWLQEAHGGRGRPLAAAGRLRGDGALARPLPPVQVIRESRPTLPGSTSQSGPCLISLCLMKETPLNSSLTNYFTLFSLSRLQPGLKHRLL